jgi:signal transduction histidine kinase
MADKLERSEADRRRMIRDVAHELRTPLTNLRGQLEAMQDGLRHPDDAGIGSLLEETMLLERLVGDLGQLAEADAGRLDVRIEAVALDVEARRAIEAFSQDERAPADRITSAVPSGLVVRADPRRLGQILRNLVDNALVHAPGSDVRIEAARHGADRIEVAVVDGGPGIPAEHVGRVFDRLYRADPSRARATGGAGLGLAIVRGLVEAQGGEVGVDGARPGGGTRVWFRLPSG